MGLIIGSPFSLLDQQNFRCSFNNGKSEFVLSLFQHTKIQVSFIVLTCNPLRVLLTRETTLFNGFRLTSVACASSTYIKFELQHLIRMGSSLTLEN